MLCTEKKCSRCDLAYVIKDYITPLLQLLTNDLYTSYNMQLRTTKCLNTGILLMTMMAGQKGLDAVTYCRNNTVIERHRNGETTNYQVMDELCHTLLSKKFKNRQLYYILITDGKYQRGSEEEYFPGHAFVFEKYKENGKVKFNLYQSYINQYDIQGHFERYNSTFEISRERMAELLNDLSYVLLKDVWDSRCSQIWEEFTKVRATQFEGFDTRDRMFLCYRAITLQGCIENIERYVRDSLQKVRSASVESPHEIYGDPDKYVEKHLALTNSQLEQQLQVLLDSIRKNVNKH